MTKQELISLFKDHNDETTTTKEFLKFERVQAHNSLTTRPDLYALVLIDKRVPGNSDIIGDSAHDEIFLSVNPDDLASVATREDIIDLIRCGVRYDSQWDSFAMFV